MITVFQITLLFVIVASLIEALDKDNPLEVLQHSMVLCVIGILAFTCILVVL